MVTSLINDFRKFLDIVEDLEDENIIELVNILNLPPTTLMSLLMYFFKNLSIDNDLNIARDDYKTILNENSYHLKLFFEKIDFDNIDDYWDNFSNSFPKIDSNILFLIFQELISNILEYSKSKNSFFMGYTYSNSSFIDICCYDDGISIPASFENVSIPSFSDSEAIYDAINGKSIHILKNDFSYNGLNRISKLFTSYCNSEILIASRGGVCYIDKEGAKLFEINKKYVKGTLISMRIPKNISKKEIISSLNPNLIYRTK